MSKLIEVPQLSPTIEEGVLSAWHKQEGDEVGVDDLLADVQADGTTVGLRASDAGTLLKRLVPDCTTVKTGQPVAVLGAAGEDISSTLADLAALEPAQETAPGQEAPVDGAPAAAPPDADHAAEDGVQAAESPEPSDAQANGAQAHAPDSYRSVVVEDDEDDESSTLTALLPPRMPAAQSAGGSEGTDLDAMGADLAAARTTTNRPSAQPVEESSAVLPAFADPDVYPLSTMRRAVARRLAEAKQNVPHSYLTIDIDATSLVALRDQINAELRETAEANQAEEGGGLTTPKVTLNDLIIKACAVALVRVPACNAQFTPEAILIHRRVDISVSVAVPDGFVTPVVRNADTKTVLSIAEEVRELAARARLKTLAIEEITQGTFSISNLGMFGIDEFSAVVNPPEGAILAVGRAREAAVVQDGELAVGRRMTLTLSCDHRAVDGAVGAAFLAELRGLLEHPMRILTG